MSRGEETAVAALPIMLLAIAMAGIGQRFSWNDLRHWLKRILLWGVALIVLWNCILWSGLWLSIPPLRTWRINNLTSVDGGKTELVISSQQSSGADISPDGRWLMVKQRGAYLLLDLETGEERRIDMDISVISRWVTDDLWAAPSNHGGSFLMSVSDLTRTEFPRFESGRGRDGNNAVKELLRQSDHIYAVKVGGGYYYLVTGDDYHYTAQFPGGITIEEVDAFLAELPQVTLIPDHGRMNPTMIPEINAYKPLSRYYSPDGSLYASALDGVKIELGIYMAANDELVATVYKKYYTPDLIGWSTDGTGFYFTMIRPLPSGYPTHVLWLPDETVQAAKDAMPDDQSSGLKHSRSSLFRRAAQYNSLSGWYIDDLLVEEAPPPRPTGLTAVYHDGLPHLNSSIQSADLMLPVDFVRLDWQHNSPPLEMHAKTCYTVLRGGIL